MRNKSQSNDAVSPVIAVMLMLVVTIIIAAIVSAFAGGLGGTSQKTPQIVLKGTYSQENGMTLTHASGDPVTLTAIDFMTTPSEIMGTDAGKFAWIVNKTILLDPANSMKPVYNISAGIYNTQTFKSGDTLVVNATSCEDYREDGSGFGKDPHVPPGVNANARIFWVSETHSKSAYFGAYAFGNPKNIGKYFYLDMVDSTGSVISRAVVTITG